MKVIRDHSANVYKLMGSVPPRPSCIAEPGTNTPGMLGAWFGAKGNACVNDPEAAAAWHVLYGPDADATLKAADLDYPEASLARAKALAEREAQVFVSKAACCAPNTGAFTAGC